MKNRVVWKDGENIFVVRKGKTSNDKISDGKPLVQTYTFSEKQWVLASTSKGFGMKKFFALDGSNCLDCPFSVGNGNGGCYTHKFNQLMIAPSIVFKAPALHGIAQVALGTQVREQAGLLKNIADSPSVRG